MNYSVVKYCDIANGPGVRTVLFISGCRNHCKECFQPETWSFSYGQIFDNTIKQEILNSLSPSYVQGLTLLGGDPMEPENQRGLVSFVKEVKKAYPAKDIWAYTGYILEKDLTKGGKCFTEVTDELLSYIDVLVDGPFELEKKDMMLKFRGSSNQRLIDLKHFLKTGKICKP